MATIQQGGIQENCGKRVHTYALTPTQQEHTGKTQSRAASLCYPASAPFPGRRLVLLPACSLEDNRKPQDVVKQAASAHSRPGTDLQETMLTPGKNGRKKAVTQELESHSKTAPEHKQAPHRPGRRKRRDRDVSSSSGTCCSLGEILKGKVMVK